MELPLKMFYEGFTSWKSFRRNILFPAAISLAGVGVMSSIYTYSREEDQRAKQLDFVADAYFGPGGRHQIHDVNQDGFADVIAWRKGPYESAKVLMYDGEQVSLDQLKTNFLTTSETKEMDQGMANSVINGMRGIQSLEKSIAAFQERSQ